MSEWVVRTIQKKTIPLWKDLFLFFLFFFWWGESKMGVFMDTFLGRKVKRWAYFLLVWLCFSCTSLSFLFSLLVFIMVLIFKKSMLTIQCFFKKNYKKFTTYDIFLKKIMFICLCSHISKQGLLLISFNFIFFGEITKRWQISCFFFFFSLPAISPQSYLSFLRPAMITDQLRPAFSFFTFLSP